PYRTKPLRRGVDPPRPWRAAAPAAAPSVASWARRLRTGGCRRGPGGRGAASGRGGGVSQWLFRWTSGLSWQWLFRWTLDLYSQWFVREPLGPYWGWGSSPPGRWGDPAGWGLIVLGDDFAVSLGAEGAQGQQADLLADELDGAVGEGQVGPARMLAAVDAR